MLAFHFDVSQGQACQWIHILSEVLRLTLAELEHTPERDPQKVKELLESYIDESQECSGNETESETSTEKFAIDGTERRLQRPKDQEKQKRFYSGKTKYTVKNNVIVTLGNRRVEYLGRTWEGKKHDKNICEYMSFQKEAPSIKTQVSRDMNQRECIPVNLRRSRWVES